MIMKKLLFLSCVLSVCIISGCNKNESSPNVKSVTLSKVGMTDASYFVVVNPSKEALKSYNLKSDTIQREKTIPYLCAMTHSGELEIVSFQYKMEGATDEAKAFVENNLFVVPTSFVSIGQNYIWLRDCRYYVTDETNCPAELQTVISELKNDIYQYVVRKKDGGILDLSEIDHITRLYDNSDFYIPKGYISPTENGFYVLSSNLLKVTDNNDSKPIIETVLPDNCLINSFVCQNDAIIAMGRERSEDGIWKPMVFYPDGKIDILRLNTKVWDKASYDVVFSANGIIYYVNCIKNELDQSELTTYRLTIGDNTVFVDSLCTQIVPFVYSDVAQYLPRYTEESTVAFMNGNRLISFSSETERFEMKEIAEFNNVVESFPSFDGCIYGYENNSLGKVYRYNLATTEVSELTIDKTAVVPFGYEPAPEFSASKNIFIQYGENTQGKDMTVVTDIATQTAYYIEAEGKRVSSIYRIQ